MGIDVGKVRVGVARSDPDGLIATPVATVARGAGDVAEILRIAAELEAFEFVVGLPLALSGRHTASTGDAVAFAEALAGASTTPVRMVDERLSTVAAGRNLRASGRNARRSRAVIDQAAAVIILQHALDFERAAGTTPGAPVVPQEGL
ncbi:Holliday junction resolvase RuvX [Parafrigoribacterium mesophilum]|uniref:Holliday junction resolvase RuvX n=1 Tax=Parafrigoribacterium mesophilum TaxID=433646 RepID=UPI0031FC3181